MLIGAWGDLGTVMTLEAAHNDRAKAREVSALVMNQGQIVFCGCWPRAESGIVSEWAMISPGVIQHKGLSALPQIALQVVNVETG